MLVVATHTPLDLHQAPVSYIRPPWAMAALLLWLAAVQPALAAGAAISDAVNERLPVSRGELEAHWQVDCDLLWAALAIQVGSATSPAGCVPGPQTRHRLQLCAFIYQPPGEVPARACPDYRAVLTILDSPGSRDQCEALADYLAGPGRCPLAVPGEK